MSSVLFVEEPDPVDGAEHVLPDFTMHYVKSVQEAIYKIDFGGSFNAVICGLPLQSVIDSKFLEKIAERLPWAVNVLLVEPEISVTSLARAVNAASIFRVLPRPVSSEVLTETLIQGLTQQQHHGREERLHLDTARGLVNALTESVSLLMPGAAGPIARMRALARELCALLEIDNAWEVEVACVFAHIAALSLPEVVQSQTSIPPHQLDLLAMVSRSNVVAQRLAAHVPRFERVRDLVRAAGRLARSREQQFGAAAWAVYLATTLGRLLVANVPLEKALRHIASLAQKSDQSIQAAVGLYQARANARDRLLRLDEVRAGMTLVDPIWLPEGVIAAPARAELTESLIERLRQLAALGRIDDTIRVNGMALVG